MFFRTHRTFWLVRRRIWWWLRRTRGGAEVDADSYVANDDFDFLPVNGDFNTRFSTGFDFDSKVESSTANERVWRNLWSSSNFGNESKDVIEFYQSLGIRESNFVDTRCVIKRENVSPATSPDAFNPRTTISIWLSNHCILHLCLIDSTFNNLQNNARTSRLLSYRLTR